MEVVTFLSDNLIINATLVLPNDKTNKHSGVVIFHGMNSSKASYVGLAQELASYYGIAALAVSMRGHGESEGDFNRSTVGEALNDALVAYDFLVAQPRIDTSRIGLTGSSVGAILAATTTTERPVKSMVLRAPAAYTREMMKLSMADTMVNEGRQFHEITNLPQTLAGQAITDFSGSLLIIASGKDHIIPATITTGYLEIARKTNKKELLTLQGAPHNLSGTQWKEQCNRVICEWFADTL